MWGSIGRSRTARRHGESVMLKEDRQRDGTYLLDVQRGLDVGFCGQVSLERWNVDGLTYWAGHFCCSCDEVEEVWKWQAVGDVT